MTIEHKDIHEAINAVMQEVGYVQKQAAKELRYTYAGEAALIEAIRPSMVTHGIYMYVRKVKKIYRSTYETKSGTNMFNTLTEGVVRFAHVSGTHIDVEATGEGSDSGDKSANKAMTGLYKYAMRQTFCIETGDDPDGFDSAAMERKSASKPVQAAPQRREGFSAEKPNQKPEPPATMPPDDHQKPANAPDGENGAVTQAKEMADGYTGNQILGSKDGELVKEIVRLSGKSTVEVCKFVGALEKGKKFTLGQVVKALTGETA